MSDSEKNKWQKTNTLGVHRNIAEPLLEALKQVLIHEREELQHKLNNLKQLGVIQMNTAEVNKKLEEIKFK